ncbi:MAG: ABC transporter substrate-binding protein [Candidatus Caldarchaeum sp.]|uniref:Leucine-binding protein domain-containing protein n=1 Tax=Caldiarchaeum subterraneum TaxID=311458 RepID=A0A7C5LBF6_CALS0
MRFRRDVLKLALVGALAFAAGRFTQNTLPQNTSNTATTAKTEPTQPVKLGLQTILTGPGVVIGAPLLKGAQLAVKTINEAGGLLNRKIETVVREESGIDQTLKEFRRMALVENVDYYVGAIESVNTVVLGPEAESLGLLAIFVDGGTESLFIEKVPRPRAIFRTSNIDTVDAYVTVSAIKHWFRNVERIAAVYPDDVYGQLTSEVVEKAVKKLLPSAEVVYTGWPPPFTTDYSIHITSLLGKKPDILIAALWGGDFITFYKQAYSYNLFKDVKLVSTYGFSAPPHYYGWDLPEGSIMGAHANYYFLYPPWGSRKLNKDFNEAYFKMWNEYPGTHAELAYLSTFAIALGVMKSFQETGEHPDTTQVSRSIEGLGFEAPGGYVHYRSEDHQAVRNPPIGRSKRLDGWKFPVWDPSDVLALPKERVVPPPGVRMVKWIEESS